MQWAGRRRIIISCSNPEHSARNFFKVSGEILRSHGWSGESDYMVSAEFFSSRLLNEIHNMVVADNGRDAFLVNNVAFCPHGRSAVGNDLPDLFFHQGTGLVADSAHSSFHNDFVRNNVGCSTAGDLSDGEDCGIERCDCSRNNGL